MKNSLILLMILLLVSCKKEQPQMTSLNQECDCAKEVSAEFVMEEINCYNNPNSFCNFWTNTDTIFDMHEGYIYNHLNGIFELNIRFFSEVNINHIKLHYFGRRL